ncbi:toxin-antitoxin system, antitoxin component, Xre family protein [Acidaminococcus sp.]|uniref:toxin-antitoxin system, antitoxin component, Xre family protein n=1 Tax=Acidaminococcus sp. TaxID=1872103 RepID=UPI0026DC6C71|nr:toxin-antitoxin system, antitoxin component, Xre family protein [uncultured Acidaminococcus sp.]
MTDTAELNAAIARAGITKKDLVKALGLTYAGFWKKIHNLSEFKATEIKKLQELLKLSDEERDHIFFAEISD